VLVVEDDPSSRSALGFLLARAGFEVLLAESLAQAFAAVRAVPSKTPDSIILDLMLPDGDGVQLLEHVRNHHPQTRIVIATGVLDEAWLKRVESFGPVSILRKPIIMSELLKDL
jgi:DNA-binding response OmpR family regulator